MSRNQSISAHMRMRVCVCVCEKERKKERKKERRYRQWDRLIDGLIVVFKFLLENVVMTIIKSVYHLKVNKYFQITPQMASHL